MHSLKTTLILSLTALILLASYIVYNNQHERFVFIPINTDKSIYVFDRKNKTLNYCTSDNQCKQVSLNLHNETDSSGVVLPSILSRLIGGANMNESRKGTDQNTNPSGITISATHIETANQALVTKQVEPVPTEAVHIALPAAVTQTAVPEIAIQTIAAPIAVPEPSQVNPATQAIQGENIAPAVVIHTIVAPGT